MLLAQRTSMLECLPLDLNPQYSNDLILITPRKLLFSNASLTSCLQRQMMRVSKIVLSKRAELFAASNDGSVSFKNTPQFESPALSETPPALKEVNLDLVCYGGYKFPYGILGEASAADAPAPSGQAGITTGYPKSIDISAVPVREVSALKIGEK